MKKVASIDIGSYTARLLIAAVVDPPKCYQPLKREREYIRLADGFNKNGGLQLKASTINQAVKVLEKFVPIIDQYEVEYVSVVATGVVRRAANRQELLEAIYNRTGLQARVISGEEEARLTELGVSGSVHAPGKRRIIFDLGGGSTEFIFSRGELKSIPLGAMLLTQQFLDSDPPNESMLDDLSKYIKEILEKALDSTLKKENMTVIGTGGTVTTLAAMAKRVETRDISHERLNHTILKLNLVHSIFTKLKEMNAVERSRIIGLDPERADVILAGVMVVLHILYFFNSPELVVSLSDMLEGLILDHLKEN